MQDKFSWYASAFLLWMVVSFIAVVAMFVKGFEGMLGGVDDTEIIAAGALAIMAVSLGLAVLFACLFHFAPWERVWRPAADLTRHAVALMSGGFLATLFACWGFLGLLVGAAVTAAYARWSPKSASRPWVDPARISLAWCTAAVPIVLNLI